MSIVVYIVRISIEVEGRVVQAEQSSLGDTVNVKKIRRCRRRNAGNHLAFDDLQNRPGAPLRCLLCTDVARSLDRHLREIGSATGQTLRHVPTH